MKITISMICGGLVVLSVVGSLAANKGTGRLEGLQSKFDEDLSYSANLDAAQTNISRANREAEIVFKMVLAQGCTPVYGISAANTGSKKEQLRFVEIPLRVGAVVTIGGKHLQQFAPGTLVCDSTGQVGVTDTIGAIRSPINPEASTLPRVAQEKKPALDAYLANVRSQVATNSIPQAVVSTPEELQNIANRQAEAMPVTTTKEAIPIATPPVIEMAPPPQSAQSPSSPVLTDPSPQQETGIAPPPPIN
jgi:hypothetical protein